MAGAAILLAILQGAAPSGPAVELGGRLMFDAVAVGGPGAKEVGGAAGTDLTDGAEVRRARLDAKAPLAPDLRGALGLEFAGGATRFREASVSWTRDAGEEWRLGYTKLPFFLDLSGSSNDYDLLEAPLGEDALAPGRQAGLLWSAWSDAAGMSAALYRRVPDKTGSSDSAGYGAAARGVWRPWRPRERGGLLHLAADFGWERPDGLVSYSARPEEHLLPVLLDTGEQTADAVVRAGAELGWTAGRWHGAAEWMALHLDAPEAENPVLRGWNLSAGCFLTGETRPYDPKRGVWSRVAPIHPYAPGGDAGGAWEAVARVSALDFTDVGAGTLDVQSLGLDWYWTEHLRVLFMLQRSMLADLDPVYALGMRLSFDF